MKKRGIDKVCALCGEPITYDQEDGYWDSFLKEENGIKYYTYQCSDGNSHKPNGENDDTSNREIESKVV